VFGVISRSRSSGVLLLALAAIAAPYVSPLLLSALAAAALVFVAIWETLTPPHGTAHAEAAVEAKTKT
jgi:hypothetical protein